MSASISARLGFTWDEESIAESAPKSSDALLPPASEINRLCNVGWTSPLDSRVADELELCEGCIS